MNEQALDHPLEATTHFSKSNYVESSRILGTDIIIDSSRACGHIKHSDGAMPRSSREQSCG